MKIFLPQKVYEDFKVSHHKGEILVCSAQVLIQYLPQFEEFLKSLEERVVVLECVKGDWWKLTKVL